MQKLLYHPIAKYLATVFITLFILFVLGSACALLGKYLSRYAAVRHSQIKSSHRDELLSLMATRSLSTCDSVSTSIISDCQVAILNSIGYATPITGAKPLTRAWLACEPQDQNRLFRCILSAQAGDGTTQWNGRPILVPLELGPVNPARLTAANRTL